MESKETVAFLETSLARLLAWVGAADSKVAAFFAIDAAMLGVLAALAADVETLTTWSTTVATISTGALILAVGLLAIASFPRLTGPPKSLIYFGGIQDLGYTEYSRRVDLLSESDYIADLKRQCHRNAEIADAKFRYVRHSSRLTIFASPIWLYSVYLLY